MVYRDRLEAGDRLGADLTGLAGRRPVVLGLPRGGVPVAARVAAALDAPLDVIVVRKLGVPGQPELALGAIGEGGARVLNDGLVRQTGATPDDIARVEEHERAVLEDRAVRYRAIRPRVPLDRRFAIIVDDGLATGATARAACAVARELGAASVVVAAPVGSREAVRTVGAVADEVVCPLSPHEFSAVGAWYHDFAPVPDSEVDLLLARAAAKEAPAADDDVLVGWEELPGHLTIPPGARSAIVFAHGSGSGARSPRNRDVARTLNEAGLGTLLFDLLTDEEADRTFDIPFLASRLEGATRWLHAKAPQLAIGYFGSSTGAAAALRAASSPVSPATAVVSRGGRPDLAGECLGAVRAPTLLIVGGADPDVLDLNRAAATRLTCPHHIEIVPNATHLFAETGTLQKVASLATSWFLRYLP
ncbi:phosphoribosyltransferase [Actinocorallia sp. API 0066]|uniref:phosphoribosyltransferase family protein n=1 Tax=Actinocorallia sp. API 0066 TaxID=2896846 RepID=UPI001E60A885|nr:phosphoribosyltransferase family protein [Actinocorallia sp. API 0066]MCD0448886.1 phosphoribosyltransferase [Actinocorallia sp. API 0066]